MWERDPTLPEVIASAWAGKRPMGDLGSVADSLKEVMKCLKDWSAKNFSHVTRDIEKLRAELSTLQGNNADRMRIREKMNQLDSGSMPTVKTVGKGT